MVVYYYDPKGVQAFNGFYDFAGPRQDVRYFDGNGQMYRGLHDMYGNNLPISMKGQVFQPKTSSSALRTDPHVTSFQIRKSRSQPFCAKS